MKRKYTLARSLRRSLSPPEYILWERLRNRFAGGPVFRRQVAFGAYILDFYCVKAKLAVEVDGAQHTLDTARERDAARDAFCQEQGVLTLRIPAPEIFRDPDSVADGVWDLAIERMKRLQAGRSL